MNNIHEGVLHPRESADHIKESIEVLQASESVSDQALEQIKKDVQEISQDISSTIMAARMDEITLLPEEITELQEIRLEVYNKIDTAFSQLFLLEVEKKLTPSSKETAQKPEDSINLNENQWEVLSERLSNPTIKNQLMHLLYCDQKYMSTSEKSIESQDSVEAIMEKTKQELEIDTPITFTGEMPRANREKGRESMDVLWEGPFEEMDGREKGTLMKSITEAHEKGHTIRRISSGGAAEYLNQGLDVSVIEVSEEDQLKLNKFYRRMGDLKQGQDASREELRESIVAYMSDPMEIVERMSQLKNYFGFRGDEIFTRDHLEYAKVNYVKDTNEDNFMRYFFQSITPERTDAFLRLINSCGI